MGKENFKFRNFSDLEIMMLNIHAEGLDEAWEDLDSIEDPMLRIYNRKLYEIALKKLKEGK